MKKKSNLGTLLSLILLLALVIFLLCSWGGDSGSSDENNDTSRTDQNSENVPSIGGDVNSSEIGTSSTENDSIGNNSSSEDESTENLVNKPVVNVPASMEDALFIGDSRTVGLMEYAQIVGPDFFCNVGMSVYNIHKEPVTVAGVGDVSLTELLEKKEYGKIYIMLGINEIGYNFKTTVSRYQDLIQLIQEKQPEATVFVQANLHVSKKRSDGDKIINNTNIDALNAELIKLADNEKVFYMDANKLLDDENGALSSQKSGDGVHLYGKYYQEWGEWIAKETASLIGTN